MAAAWIWNDPLEDYLAAAFAPPPAWMRDAACREHPDVEFFPERGQSAEPAKAICAGCAVRAECLEHALRTRVAFGIWGGRSERERRRLRRARELARLRRAATADPAGRWR